MYFKSILIKGYKGFSDTGEIPLQVPDGTTPGSGLNILAGENGSGKTSLLKAISFLTINSFSGQSRISYSDFFNGQDIISIIGILDATVRYKMPSPWKKVLDIKKFQIEIKKRERKTPGKYLSPPLTISNILEPSTRKPEWYKEGEIGDFYLGFDNERFDDDELNVFYWDEDRNRQLKKGFSTTLTRIIDDLNWKYIKGANKREIYSKWVEFSSKIVEGDIVKDIKTLMKDVFGREDLSSLNLELFNLQEPFSQAFFALCKGQDLLQVPLSDLGSGVDFLFSILFLMEMAKKSKGTIVYCIDEPELSLHPQWQKILFEILKDESKRNQIFIATHSPYFIDFQVLRGLKKLDYRKSVISINCLKPGQLTDPKMHGLFSLENREILFSRATILVEGWEDRNRIRKFLQSNNNDIFVIDGLQNLERIKRVCNDLGINFKAIVDLDYLRNYEDMLPKLDSDDIEALEELKHLSLIKESAVRDEKLSKEISKVMEKLKEDKLKFMGSKITLAMSKDAEYRKKVQKKIEELKSQSIYVLPGGMIEDYLSPDGKPISEKLGKELFSIIF